jgi:hypothetical protein
LVKIFLESSGRLCLDANAARNSAMSSGISTYR